jgi:hypothetical protein
LADISALRYQPIGGGIMGRGLSSIQKHILEYASVIDNPRFREDAGGDAVPWLDLSRPKNGGLWTPYSQFCQRVQPSKFPGEWTHAERVAISKALARLERRGLITRSKGKRRTRHISITDEGRAYLESHRGGG